MDFTDNEREYLTTQRLGRLATVGPKGDPQNNPVGYAINDDLGTIDIHGYNLGATRKFRNVQGNDQVSLVIDDLKSVKPWEVRGIEIRGRAEALSGQPKATDHTSPEVIRIHPHTVFVWGLDGDGYGITKRTAG